MYVQVVVETPQNLTKKQQELLAEFEKLSSGATQPEAAGFFTKVKDFFGHAQPSSAVQSTRSRLDRFGCYLYLFMTIFLTLPHNCGPAW